MRADGNHRVIFVLWALCLLVLTTPAGAQHAAMPSDGSLPPELVAHFGTATFVDDMELASTQGFEARVTVGFENAKEPYVVRFRWMASQVVDGQTVHAKADSVETLSFMPTAVTCSSSQGRTLFVAGWHAVTQASVVERWTFGEPVFETVTDPDGAHAGIFSPPPVTREVIFQSMSEIAAARSIAFHPVSKSLVLFESGPEANVHVLTMSGALTKIADAWLLPDLATMADIRFRSHQDMAYGAFFVELRSWSKAVPTRFLLVPDRDGDGVFEVADSRTYDSKELRLAFVPGKWQAVIEPSR